MPEEEVFQPTITRQSLEKNGNEKKEGEVISSRMFGKLYKRLRKPRDQNVKSLPVLAAKLFFLSKQPVIGKKRKRRIGMIQKANILEEEHAPFKMSYIINNNDLLDKLSEKMCFYILNNLDEKLHSLCTGGCPTEQSESPVNYKKREGGAQASIKEGTGKKFRKIFVRI